MTKLRAVEIDQRRPPVIYETVESLLSDVWYPTTVGSPDLGVGKCAPMFRQVRPAAGNVLDDDEEIAHRSQSFLAGIIESCIDSLPTQRLRIAVELHAANGAGAAVWRSGRMNPEQTLSAWQEARPLLERAFIKKGLLSGIAD